LRWGIPKKLASTAVVLLLVSFGTYMLVSLLPGDPAVAILGSGHPKGAYARLDEELGLDRPVLIRYGNWLLSALTGDLGNTLTPPGGTVVQRIMLALPVSVELAIAGLIIALIVSVPLAMWSAYRPNGRVDRIISVGTFGSLSTPSFLSGLILVLLFARETHLLPPTEWVRMSTSVLGNLYHLVLPAVTISLVPAAVLTRVLRSELITTMQEDFILTARAKGMAPWRILFRDALRPSSFSLVTVLGVQIGVLIGSTVVVEQIYALPGMGTLIVEASTQGDVRVVQGAVLIIAVIYVLTNLVIDMGYGLLDPRVRHGGG
jgi:peptide/nickel transport system permease protein